MGTHERILALDLGRKRIGLAISDELGYTAQGLDTLEREGRRDDIETLRRLAVERGVTRFLMGDPLHMSGAASRQGDYTREFAGELERKTGLPIEFRDERWTSREAERTIRGQGVANRERKPVIDRLSAVILLQSYLDSRRLDSQRPDAQHLSGRRLEAATFDSAGPGERS